MTQVCSATTEDEIQIWYRRIEAVRAFLHKPPPRHVLSSIIGRPLMKRVARSLTFNAYSEPAVPLVTLTPSN